jgi:uncharacterized protein (TIGR03435 family)
MVLTVAVLCALIVAAAAQQPPAFPQFEVVSVKRNTTNSGDSIGGMFRGGRLQSVNVTAENLIRSAYRSEFFVVDNLPGWAKSERYDVSAVAPAGSTQADVSVMLGRVLSDRFKLRAHTEQRQVDGYQLTRIRPDSLGADLRPLTEDCETFVPEPPRTLEDFKKIRPCAGARGGNGFYGSGTATAAELIRQMREIVGAPVSDQTGLTGVYVAQLRWNHDPGGPTGDPSLPSLFAAVEEQLGLRLKPSTEPIDVLVIDNIERPTEN